MELGIRNRSFASYENDIRALAEAFYPGVRLVPEGDVGFVLDVDALGAEIPAGLPRFEEKTALKRLLYRQLSGQSKRTLPWGTLTGIRPVRIVEMLEREGLSGEEISRALAERFCLSGEKIRLVTKIAEKEKQLLSAFDFREGCSVYIGIPFCPSRCLYCSFTSYSVTAWADRMDEYLDALIREMQRLASGAAGPEGEEAPFDLRKLQTVYVGGGTPTALDSARLDRLLGAAQEIFGYAAPGAVGNGKACHRDGRAPAGGRLLELTVEAGRPDSITREKLAVLRDHGVSRISINPQSLQQKTLDLIGRRHTVRQTEEAYALARSMGFDNINMDLIMGLPGEDTADVRDTLERVRALAPESLTVHTLAVKRAARLSTEGLAWDASLRLGAEADADGFDALAEMTRLGAETAVSLSMAPYYIYRQKNMAGSQDNVGYALPGRECLYNVLMMEEKHSVYGLGAGASTKRILRGAGDGAARVLRSSNPRDIAKYIDIFR